MFEMRPFSDKHKWLRIQPELAEMVRENAPAPEPEPIGPPEFTLGLDLGQQQDFSALTVVQRSMGADGQSAYAIPFLHRWPLGTPYTTIANDVAGAVYDPQLGNPRLAVDRTGCGAPVVEMIAQGIADKAKPGVDRPDLISIYITGGAAATQVSYGEWNVSKSLLVSTVVALMSGDRLKIAPELAETETLVRELRMFKAKISAAGNELTASWREKDHDDMVLATALALWSAENAPRGKLQIWV